MVDIAKAKSYTEFVELIGKVPLQLLIILIDIRIFKDIETLLASGGFLNTVYDQTLKLVEHLSNRINGVSPKIRRIYEQLIIDLVHKKEMVDSMMKMFVNSMYDFNYMMNLR
jgi:uncharacterized protein YaaN involved in tellurite resistance